MLSTLLRLASLVRTSSEAALFHLYARECPYQKKKDETIFRRIIVDENLHL